MRVVLHPKVFSDIDEVMRYYERIPTRRLADQFYRTTALHAAGRRESRLLRNSRAWPPPRELAAIPLSLLVSYRWRCRANSRRASPQEKSHPRPYAPIMLPSLSRTSTIRGLRLWNINNIGLQVATTFQ